MFDQNGPHHNVHSEITLQGNQGVNKGEQMSEKYITIPPVNWLYCILLVFEKRLEPSEQE